MKYWLALVLSVILCCGILCPHIALAEEPMDAHFYIRYDSTTPNEDAPNESQNHQFYFPLGETAPGWVPGKDTDRFSPDGKVFTNAANVPGSEQIISSGHVNLYHSFDVDENSIKQYFNVVYNNIAVSPSNEEIYKAVKTFMGDEWANAYSNDKVDVLWYVIKYGQDKIIHVDGVLYYTATGDIVDKNNPSPIEPEPTPIEPSKDEDFGGFEEPLDPGFNIDEEEPIIPEPDTPEIIVPDDTNDVTNEEQNPVLEERNDSPREEKIEDTEVPLSSGKELPQTSDESYKHIWNLLICLTITFVICAIALVNFSEK